MYKEIADYDFLICPFTGRNLRFLSERELSGINSKIEKGELYFYPGAQATVRLEQALVTEQQTYIYPVFDDILYLKRETSIVSRNRTKNYLKRVNDSVIREFEAEYYFNTSENGSVKNELSTDQLVLSEEEVLGLRSHVSKTGKLFVSIGSNDIDAIHNSVFNSRFSQYVHLDFSIRKLMSTRSEMPENTLLILCDKTHLPISNGSIDSMISFDSINRYEKKEQEEVYEEIKRVMSPSGASIVAYDQNEPLHAMTKLKSDQISKKAIRLIKPWKKIQLPSINFYGLRKIKRNMNESQIVGKTSLDRQFS